MIWDGCYNDGWQGQIVPEVWKSVPGTNGLYEVSNRGRVRSHHSIGHPKKDGMMSLYSNAKGYLRVRITVPGQTYTIVVHRLVLGAFIGPRPSRRHEANHKNGVKSDNRADNLEWVTPKENNAHAIKTGLWHPNIGEAHGRHKLTEVEVRDIRGMEGQIGANELGGRYGVSSTAIRLIWRRINWQHVV